MLSFTLILPLLFILSPAIGQSDAGPQTHADSPMLADSVRPRTLCDASERAIWSCEIVKERKIASVCSSKVLDDSRGYVQYRFGRVGQIELEYPRERTKTQTAFIYSRYTRPLVTYLKLSFVNEGVRYTISDDYNEEEGTRGRYAAIAIKNSDGNSAETTLRCRLPVTGSLMSLEGIVQREETP